MVGTEAWNDTRLINLVSPILALVSVFLGRSFGVHLVSSELGESLIVISSAP